MADKIYYSGIRDRKAEEMRVALSNIEQGKGDLIDWMLKNHTLVPDESYGGYLVFNTFGKKLNTRLPFHLDVEAGDYTFSATGKLFDARSSDEYDLPDSIGWGIF